MSARQAAKSTWGIVIAFGLATGIAGAYWYAHRLGVECAERTPAASQSVPTVTLKPLPSATFGKDAQVSIADVTARVVHSVVNVYATKVQTAPDQHQQMPFFNDPFFRRFFGAPEAPAQRQERSLGSGVIIDNKGTILTNNHVVQNAQDIRISLSDKRDLDAELIGTDPQSDLAVLRLKKPPKDIHPLQFGDSSRLRLGDVVLAIGNPFGVGQTVTMGIVSATGRANMGIVDYEDFIQTDAAINPGNSGGALVDLEGHLVGINTAILSRTGGYQGIGFAIPSNMARPVMQSLMAHGKVVRGWLGVTIQDVDTDLSAALGLSSSEGVLVGDVAQGSPAERAGVRRGDVILQLNDKPVDSSAKLRNLVAMLGPNATVKLQIVRDKKPMTVSVQLTPLPAELLAKRSQEDVPPKSLSGLSLAPLNAATRRAFGIPPTLNVGVVVTKVAPGTPAHDAGLRPGDVVVEINRQPVGSVEQAMMLYQRAQGRVLLWVQRGNARTFLVLPKAE